MKDFPVSLSLIACKKNSLKLKTLGISPCSFCSAPSDTGCLLNTEQKTDGERVYSVDHIVFFFSFVAVI